MDIPLAYPIFSMERRLVRLHRPENGEARPAKNPCTKHSSGIWIRFSLRQAHNCRSALSASQWADTGLLAFAARATCRSIRQFFTMLRAAATSPKAAPHIWLILLNHDEWVTASARRTMERQLKAAGRPYTGYEYDGTGHWFAETDRQNDYVIAAAELAFNRTVAHFEATLRQRGFLRA